MKDMYWRDKPEFIDLMKSKGIHLLIHTIIMNM